MKQKSGLKFLIFPISLILFFSSCLHESDLTEIREVSYQKEIQPIIAANCAYSGCHGNGQFALSDYNSIVANGDIKPGDARGSKLYKSITKRGLIEYMPPAGKAQLSDNDIQLIFVWIEKGAKNN